MPQGFLKVGSKERVFLENRGLGSENSEILGLES